MAYSTTRKKQKKQKEEEGWEEREATRGSANFFAEAEVVLPHRLRHEQRVRWSRVGVEGGSGGKKIK